MQSPWEEGRRCGKGEPWMMSPLLLSLWLPCRYSTRGPGSLVQCECAFLHHTCISGYTRKRYLVPVGYYVLLCLWYLANWLCWKKIMKVYKGPICNWQECFPIFLWHFWNLKKKFQLWSHLTLLECLWTWFFIIFAWMPNIFPNEPPDFYQTVFPTPLCECKSEQQARPAYRGSHVTSSALQPAWQLSAHNTHEIQADNLARASSFSQKYPVLSTYNIIRLQRVFFWPISSAPK